MVEMIKSKKAFYRTIEVLIAIVLTFFFISYFMPKFTATEVPQKPDLNLLPRLSDDESFRNCAIAGNIPCIKTFINGVIPSGYGYDLSISNDINYVKQGLPAKDIYIESSFIAANLTAYNPEIVKVYYWSR